MPISKPQIHFAQKAVVYDSKTNSILFIHYSQAGYVKDILNKYALPGGKLEFGETLDVSLVREVKEEAGILCKPGEILDMWTWTYDLKGQKQQIVAVSRAAVYVSGRINQAQVMQSETVIDKSVWIKVDQIDYASLVEDEVKSVKRFLELLR